MPDRDPWWEQAACRDADPRDFEPKPLLGRTPRTGLRKKQDWSIAQATCDGCPVKRQCLRDHLNAPMAGDGHAGHYVMFAAGHTPEELTQMKWAMIRKGMTKL